MLNQKRHGDSPGSMNKGNRQGTKNLKKKKICSNIKKNVFMNLNNNDS